MSRSLILVFNIHLLFLMCATLSFAMGDLSTDCATAGRVTINEVYSLGQNNFVEVKVLNSSAPINLLNLRICSSRKGCTVYSLSNAVNYYPYYVLNIGNNIIQLGGSDEMDISLYQKTTFIFWTTYHFYDYLSVNGYDSQQTSCSSPYDMDVSTTSNYKGVHRSPDGTGDWDEIAGTGNNGENTEGASNDNDSDNALDNFLIVHDGYGINCVAEEVTITARNSDDTIADDYTGTISLSTSTNHGTWTLKTGNGTFSDATADDGAANYIFAANDNGVAVFTLLDSYDESVDIAVSAGSITDDDSEGLLNFNPIGFVMSPNPLGTQVGCKPFPFTLTAVGQTVDPPECGVIEEYTGNKEIKFWFDYSAPTTGTETPVVGGTSVTESVSSAASQTVAFTNGVATVTAQYNDAGKIQIFARDDAGIGEPVAGTGSEIVGGLAPFVVRPFAIDLQVVGNPTAQATNGSIFITSGTAFTLNLRAVCWQSEDDANSDGVPDGHNDNDPTNNVNLTNNALTHNASGTVAVTHQLWKPTGGIAGTLAGTTSGSLTGGVGSSEDLTYSEVGIIELAATLGDYLSGGEDVVGKSGAAGRFYPHHFALEIGTLSPRSDLICTTAPTFTYLDENLTFAYKLTAQNEAGSTTTNYADGVGGFARFAGTGAVNFGSTGTYTVGVVDDPDGAHTELSERVEIVSSSKVSGWTSGAATFNIELNVNRLTVPDGPFSDTRFGVAVQDGDGVEITNLDLDVDGDVGAVLDHAQATDSTALRYGRLRLGNAHGSEMLDLPMLMQAEYWMGSAFSLNTLDSCSSFDVSKLTLDSDVETGILGTSAIKVKGVVTTSATIGNNPLTNGDGDLDLGAPGVGGDGWVDVELTVPDYLQFNWHGTGDENPTSRATFGIYPGNEHIIYIRETTWR